MWLGSISDSTTRHVALPSRTSTGFRCHLITCPRCYERGMGTTVVSDPWQATADAHTTAIRHAAVQHTGELYVRACTVAIAIRAITADASYKLGILQHFNKSSNLFDAHACTGKRDWRTQRTCVPE